MRGWLVFPMQATVAVLDTEATYTEEKYDEDFRSTVVASTDDTPGELQRVESEVTFPAQVETDRDEEQQMAAAGDVPDTQVDLIVHLADMERLGLVDLTTGALKVKKGDRLVKLADSVRVVQTFDRVPIYCTEVRMMYGFIGGRANLMMIRFKERPQGRAA